MNGEQIGLDESDDRETGAKPDHNLPKDRDQIPQNPYRIPTKAIETDKSCAIPYRFLPLYEESNLTHWDHTTIIYSDY